VSRLMHRRYSEGPTIRKVLQSLWYQLNNGQEIYVVGSILEDGTVKGGTAERHVDAKRHARAELERLRPVVQQRDHGPVFSAPVRQPRGPRSAPDRQDLAADVVTVQRLEGFCGVVQPVRFDPHVVIGRDVSVMATSAADVAIDFTERAASVENLLWLAEHGIHAVSGTTGYTDEDLERFRAAFTRSNCFIAPNFAIGAVLMMRFATEASRHMAGAEIIEYHHPAKLDAPSGTAARTAALMDGEVPIHSVRLPGIVADQDVILGDVAQTLTIRHVTTDRTSFMPGVLLAVRRVGELPDRLTVGLERLLWP